MIAEGYMKLTITNQIKHLQYIHRYNPGFALNPQTIKAIQNIDYCVNHNLPISRIKLYQIMPQYFIREIGELDEAMMRLIAEKNIFVEDEESTSSVRYFSQTQALQIQTEMDKIAQETRQTFYNMADYIQTIFLKHTDLFEKVAQGKTPFRNLEHLRTVLQSDLPIKYLPQQQALRKDIFEVLDIKKEWQNFEKSQTQKLNKEQFRPIPPPPYVENHPVLMKYHELLMQSYTKPKTLQELEFLTTGDQTEVILAQKMQTQIRKIVNQKYDPLFIQAMNSDRSKIDKKKLQIQFYTLSTNIMQNLQALQDKSSSDNQMFQKLQKPKGLLSTLNKKNRISTNYLTRMLFLNKKNKNKYNLQFFSQWFGVDQEQLRVLLNGFSYMRVPMKNINPDDVGEDDVEVLKFQI